MKVDEGFDKRWELRSSKVDGDTSSNEEGSNSRGNLVTSLALFDHDEAEADDDPRSHSHGNEEKLSTHSDDKKVKSNKKKKVERKRKRKHDFNDKAMLKDLKIFADSLVQELAVANQDMFANMRDEMSKLVASASVRKNARPSQKKTTRKVASDVPHLTRRANEVSKGDRVRLPTTLNMNPAPSHYIASQLQNQRNYNNLINTHIPYMDNRSSSGTEFCKLMAARSLFGQLEGFSFNCHPYLPFPLHQGMESGSSRPRSLSFMSEKGVSIAKFPSTSQAPSQQMIHSSIASSVPRVSEGEFVPEMSQGHKDTHLFLSGTR